MSAKKKVLIETIKELKALKENTDALLAKAKRLSAKEAKGDVASYLEELKLQLAEEVLNEAN